MENSVLDIEDILKLDIFREINIITAERLSRQGIGDCYYCRNLTEWILELYVKDLDIQDYGGIEKYLKLKKEEVIEEVYKKFRR